MAQAVLRPFTGRAPDERINWVTSIPFFIVHLLPFLAFWTGANAIDWVVCAILYFGRMFFVTGVLHRYFSHKSYSARRWFQAVLAFGSTLPAQKGFLWWASWHRVHHRVADKPEDVHSPSLKGFWWAHWGWILSDKYNHTKEELIKQWLRFPELKLINRLWWVGPTVLGVGVWLWGGWSMLLIGFFLSTVLLYHGTFFINSLAHVHSKWLLSFRTENTDDTSQNSLLLAIITMGEGWHNVHHHRARVTKQGDKWWQIDMTYYILWIMNLVRAPWFKRQENGDRKLAWIPVLVWDVTRHPQQKAALKAA